MTNNQSGRNGWEDQIRRKLIGDIEGSGIMEAMAEVVLEEIKKTARRCMEMAEEAKNDGVVVSSDETQKIELIRRSALESLKERIAEEYGL